MRIERLRDRSVRALLLIALMTSAAVTSSLAQQSGAIRGSVFDSDYQTPLAGARITIVGTTISTKTNDNGTFLIENVLPGSYILSIAKPGYARAIRRDVVVTMGGMSSVRIDLDLEIYEMETVVVTADDYGAGTELELLDIRQEALELQDSISEEFISKSGSSDVAGALGRVVGASVTDGKYATVRGLSDRYTGTTMHNIRIPSADPRRRAVQLDLFPTGTVEAITVTKTFTPDLLGDFTGGGVDIVTKSVPDDLTLSFGFGFEYDSEATNNDQFLSYIGGGVGLLDDGGRALAPIASQPFPATPDFQNPGDDDLAAAQQLDELTNAFSPVIGVSQRTPGLNRKFQFLFGDRYQFGDAVLGLLASYTQSEKASFYGGAINDDWFVSNVAPAANERTDNQGTDELLSGAIVNLTLIPNDRSEYSLRWIANYAAEDNARLQREFGITNGENRQNQSLSFAERNVASALLSGSHRFPQTEGRLWRDMSFNWTLADNLTEQNEPDQRFFRNAVTETGFAMPSNSTDPQNTRRTFRNIREDDLQLTANVELPFNTEWSPDGGRIKFGIYGQNSDREFRQNSFSYAFPTQVFSSEGIFAYFCNLFVATPLAESELWTDFFLDSDRIGLAPRVPGCEFNPDGQETPSENQLLWTIRPTSLDVNYDAEQATEAIYAMSELPISSRLQAVFGARYETTDLRIVPSNVLFGTVLLINQRESGAREVVEAAEVDGIAEIDDGDLLPSVGLIYNLGSGMKLRGAWSKTIARPTFRELAPVATEEFLAGDEFVGNPDLMISDIENFDLRWEWFRDRGELFAFSLFAKEITNPIEYISFGAAARRFLQPVNFESGELTGFEAEARIALGNYFEALDGLIVGANYTRLDSSTTVPQLEREALADFELDEEFRRLNGQPDSLTNLFVTYDREKSGTSFGLFYTRTGDTQIAGAATGLDDAFLNIFEEARYSVDMTFRQQLTDRFRLSLGGKNITGEDYVEIVRTPSGFEGLRARQVQSRRYSLSLGVDW